MVRELGYPSKRNLRRWIRLWEASDGATEAIRCNPRDPDEQKQRSVEHYFNHGCSLARLLRHYDDDCACPARLIRSDSCACDTLMARLVLFPVLW